MSQYVAQIPAQIQTSILKRMDLAKSLGDRETVTAVELLEIDRRQQQESARLAKSVAEFENECTFALGYIRQPVYVCMTCHGPESPFYGEAGICLACSMHCHLDHDIVELFSKTDFRCDCGTQKCAEACQLNVDQTSGSVPSAASIRDEFNERNVYNHNFKGLYCYCEGEYKETDTMIQCSKCDDWFHDRCISLPIPEPEKEVAFFCRPCIAACPVLRHASLQYVADKPSTSATTDVESTTAVDASAEPSVVPVESNKLDVISPVVNIPKASVCICKDIASLLEIPASDLFLRSDCDQLLCKCVECSAIYKSYSMDFLFDIEDEKTKRRNEVMFVSQQDDDLNSSAAVDAVDSDENEAALMFDGMHKAGLDAHQSRVVASGMSAFFASISAGLRSAVQQGHSEITEEIMNQVLQQATKRPRKF